MSEETGGPAFPVVPSLYNRVKTNEGMTLRDYFAAKAMQGMWSCEGIDFGPYEKQASVAYAMADAMLKEREMNTTNFTPCQSTQATGK